jgi:hypothetical protein
MSDDVTHRKKTHKPKRRSGTRNERQEENERQSRMRRSRVGRTGTLTRTRSRRHSSALQVGDLTMQVQALPASKKVILAGGMAVVSPLLCRRRHGVGSQPVRLLILGRAGG